MTIQKITWKEDLNVGYSLIDGHHKKLVSLINELTTVLASPPDIAKKNIGKVLKSIIDYTIYHFTAEEAVMRRYKYPKYEEHKKIHDDFVATMQHSQIPLLSGDIQKGIEFYNFLCVWLLDHIAVTDKMWAEFIRENYPDAQIE
ncbi:MAG: hemerythrin family protein [Spirochaetaceae bacterium]|nr:hemerythrin family protein [Spirochaetaceae bacterium]